MFKYMVKSIIITAIIFIIILSGNIMSALAVTQSDLNNIQKEIDEKEKEIEQVEKELTGALAQIQSLNAEISEYENDIDELDTKIETVNNEITEAEEQIKKAEEDYKHQKKLLEERLVAIYKSGNTTYLDVLLASEDIADFISKYHYVEEIAKCDQNLLNQIQKNKTSIEEAKALLETSKEQIEALKKSKEATAQSLKASQAVKQSYIKELSDEEAALEAELEEFEKDKKAIQEELTRIAMQSTGGVAVVPGNPSEAGFVFPVEGLNIYNINRRYYPSYPGHTGADININVRNKKVLAVKEGTVVTSKALKRADGSYRSYGEYVVIDHGNGLMTLYAHLSPNSRTVSVGEKVVQGQVLGIVGTTGNSTGLHLHFEVRINGKCVNPLPYL